jgi:outer membrane protein OmpA-like peptidoglycan-associated protein
MRVKLLLSTLMIATLCAGAAEAKRGLRVQVGKDDVDLANRQITFRLNKPADSAELKVYGENDVLLAEKAEVYDGAPAGTELTISWPELPEGTDKFRIDLKFFDTNEFWAGMSICRFHGEIPHREVVFETGKWEIRPQEAPKLDEAIPRILDMIEQSKICEDTGQALYIAGYTDTVGSIADNRVLSRKRARAIAEYLIENGLKRQKISVYVRGFGEEVLAVETEDDVDEERNRRADYIISNFPPDIPGPGGWVKIK